MVQMWRAVGIVLAAFFLVIVIPVGAFLWTVLYA